jgi:transcription elongation GreA/GreB family factor
VDDGLDVVTPDSPLGHALVGAVAGQRVTYPTPRGPVSVTVVSIGAFRPRRETGTGVVTGAG